MKEDLQENNTSQYIQYVEILGWAMVIASMFVLVYTNTGRQKYYPTSVVVCKNEYT
jgi:hypothetical protein